MHAAVENNAGNVPAFLIKLWTLVEDPSTDELIHWDTSGTSFHVYDQQRLSREILPLYFKHNNIASFIRQLNMYGFRKVTHIDQGGLKIEKDDLQFQHQYFQRGEQDMLQYIKRKVSSNQAFRANDQQLASDEVSRVLTDVKQVKSKQDTIDHDLEYIKRENKLLWREVALLRQKHHKQQQIVNKLIQFLVSLVSSNRSGLTIPTIRRLPLAINDVGQINTPNGQSPTVVPNTGSPDNDTQQRPVVSSPSPNAAVKKEDSTDENGYNIESHGHNVDEDDLANNIVGCIMQVAVNETDRGLAEKEGANTKKGGSDDTEGMNEDRREEISLENTLEPELFEELKENHETPYQPKIGDFLLSPTPTSGPIIHELPDQTHSFLVPAEELAMMNQNGTAPATTTGVNLLQSYLVSNQTSQPQTTVTATDGQPANFLMSPKIDLAPSLEDALNFGLDVTVMMPTSNAAVTAQPQTTTQTAQAPQLGTHTVQKVHPGTLRAQATHPTTQGINTPTPVTINGVNPMTQATIQSVNPSSQVTIQTINPSNQAPIRTINPASQANIQVLIPSSQIAVQAINPASQATIQSINPSNQAILNNLNPRVQTDNQVDQANNIGNQQRRKRKTGETNPVELGLSPQKKAATQYQQMAAPATISQAQAASLNNLVMANSDLNATGQAQQESEASGDDSLAVAASKDNPADELTLSSDQLDLLSSDLDGLKGILQDQYKVDPTFLMELFDSSNPWPLATERELEQLSAQQDDDEESIGASGSAPGNITGTELVEYNPRDELFPELLEDNVMGDIDDID